MRDKYKRIVDKLLRETSIRLFVLKTALAKAYVAYKKNKDKEKLLSAIMALLLELVEERIYKSIEAALGSEDETIYSIVTLKNSSDIFNERNYEASMYRIREILEWEIDFFDQSRLPVGEIDMYLSNPLGYLSMKKNGVNLLSDFRRNVKPQSGYSFVTNANITTLITYVTMKSYDNALYNIWGSKSGIIGYMGFRGSNYDCPECDSVCNIVHPLGSQVFPVHVRCCCIVVPVYA